MQMNLTKLASALLLGSSLVGCAAVVKTPYEQPSIAVPGSFQNNTALSKQIYDDVLADQWWTLFKDPQLNTLVEDVLSRNSNLAVAGINLQQARIQARQTQSQQGIRIGDARVSTGRQFSLDGDGDRSTGISLGYPGLSYELDLFGKLANQTEAARWEARATEQDLQATAQSLIGTTAQLYWQLAYLNERYSVVQQNLATAQKTYDLVRVQYRAGAVSGLDLTQAEQAIQSQQATLSQIEQQRVETRTALAVLMNMPVQQLSIQEPQRLPNIALPAIAAGLPASLLSRRPDLNAAELRLRKALANKDANKASYYPSISLTGSLSTGIGTSTSLSDALKNPVATLGAGLTLPFLQWNDMKRDLQVNELEYEKAILQYRQTIYEAFADVENALSNRTELTKQVELQRRNVELAEKTERLTEVRYRNGAVALKNLLDAQETTRNARLSLVQTRQNQYNAYVTLLQALGGSPIKQLP
ncbi:MULTISPECIES: efflux transporter outer membrane subunit [Acinetobacter]|jgi:NodT family efflux transporter outer membrane factor (OMF) lipoprotein|uniref:efflux transporter outer membrane subunit n=1 Tax=Acinetobacter TaxID=469 RepID=UPI000CDDC442|nr:MULTISPECIES: efflux transporter outer membrane subunit [Acinetobacter]MCU4323178.1 efflux transporter outer membrane subunit [Acinetobacter schindleri]POU24817.1 RND transporter [Acinetobacter sp. ACNIH3]POV78537.1 RND transporter [Acinetobacter sp. ACNIH4]